MLSRIRALPLWWQCLIACTLIACAAWACYLLAGPIGHRIVALVLLMCVSLLAMVMRTWPVLIAATLSALIWNFFFIPPVLTFHIGSTEDLLMLLLYFVIALVNAVLTLHIRNVERIARDQEEQQRSIALYNTLLNSLSHELRTPIAAILGSVDTLQDQDLKLRSEQRADLLKTVEEAAVRLDRQVKNLLNMGRSESGMLRPEADWCDVNEVIGSVLRDVDDASGHMLRFTPDAQLPLFRLDRGLLEQVLHNLVHNALVHTPQGTVVDLSAGYEREGCAIAISDNGPGFPAGERDRVFDKFYRLPGTSRGGSGLGLSIVKGFVEAMGGTVGVASNVPHGARFSVHIPAETSFLGDPDHE